MRKGVRQFLDKHAASGPVSFHMPGHKGRCMYGENGFAAEIGGFEKWDITEISGADNLFQPEGVIAETMEKYRTLYDVKKSFLLINGSSGGILAAVLSSVKRGGKLIMARNCHKSVFNALAVGDITPVYLYPETISEYGIQGAVPPEAVEKALEETPDAEAVILASPNYYGVCSDIKAIAAIVRRRGKILIVDQAHGAHLKFFGQKRDQEEGSADSGEKERETMPLVFPAPAEASGADIVINSVHKTLASLTQTAVMNICGERVDLNLLEDKLQTVESSSPSYLLMASLDMNADLLSDKGEELIKRWKEDLEWFYKNAGLVEGLKVMRVKGLDYTKLNIDMSSRGFDGNRLEKFLTDRGVFPELVSGNLVMCMTGIGNVRGDYERLIEVLKEASEKGSLEKETPVKQPRALTKKLEWGGLPEKKRLAPLEEAAGKVCAVSVIPYPPGIPIACPGEILDEEIVFYIKRLRRQEEKVIGVTEDMKIWVGES